MSDKEIGMLLQVFNHLLVAYPLRQPVSLLCGHSSIFPSNTRAAGPVIHTGTFAPCQLTSNLPPGKSPATFSSNPPGRRPVTPAAQAPVPQASVSPTPRS